MHLTNAVRQFHGTTTKDQHSSNHYVETLNRTTLGIDFVNHTKNAVSIVEDDMLVGFRVNVERSIRSLEGKTEYR